MTTKDEWVFRADYLIEQAQFLEIKSAELMAEAYKYRQLAALSREQARALTSAQGSDK